jgi:hypothetical protein
MKTLVAASVVLALSAPLALAQDPTGKYANSPNAEWFARQHNAQGGYCCSGADAHLYYGAYTINGDGSITMPLEDGTKLTIEPGKVLPFNPADPNPTGTAVLWYNGVLTSVESVNLYCIALGPLT